MYISLRDRPAGRRSPDGERVAGTVVLLGVVSLLTDVSSESVQAVLPLYLVGVLGLSPLAYGLVDGLYQGASAVVRLLGGWVADRGDHPKWVAGLGYGLSAASRIALLPATGLAAIVGVVTVDRLGKGLRTAPRDAMISAVSDPRTVSRAFGVHRALDTTGAVIGPLMAFGVLALLPDSYHSVFVVSFVAALLGLAVLLLLVPDLRPRSRALVPAVPDLVPDAAPYAVPDAAPAPRPRPSRQLLADPRLSRLCAAAGALALLTVGDGFLYLTLQQRDDLATRWFPLLYVGTNLAYLALAVPFGRLADRHGRSRVYLLGHLGLLFAYAAAAGPASGWLPTVCCLALLGAYYAATDGVLPATAGRLVDPAVRASGIATAQTVVAVARFASSAGFGLLWVLVGPRLALTIVGAVLVVALALAARPLLRLESVGG